MGGVGVMVVVDCAVALQAHKTAKEVLENALTVCQYAHTNTILPTSQKCHFHTIITITTTPRCPYTSVGGREW